MEGAGGRIFVSDSSSSDKCETFSTKQSLTSLHRNDFRQLHWFSVLSGKVGKRLTETISQCRLGVEKEYGSGDERRGLVGSRGQVPAGGRQPALGQRESSHVKQLEVVRVDKRIKLSITRALSGPAISQLAVTICQVQRGYLFHFLPKGKSPGGRVGLSI